MADAIRYEPAAQDLQAAHAPTKGKERWLIPGPSEICACEQEVGGCPLLASNTHMILVVAASALQSVGVIHGCVNVWRASDARTSIRISRIRHRVRSSDAVLSR